MTDQFLNDGKPIISSLSPREHIRTLPEMYFGGRDASALHQLVYEIVGTAIRENATTISITLYREETVSVETNGNWLSVRKRGNLEETPLEILLSNPDNRLLFKRYNISRFAILGLLAVNAVSLTMDVEARQEGYLWRKSYAEGLPISPLTQVEPLTNEEQEGYTFTFTPDFTIFEHHSFNYETLASKLRELAYLLSDITIRLHDKRDDAGVHELKFHYPDGLLTFMQYLNRDATVLNRVIHSKTDIIIQQSSGNKFPLSLEFAIQYTDEDAAFELSFANGAETSGGGTHAIALRRGVIRFLAKYASQLGYRLEHPEDIYAGFIGVISIRYDALSYAGAMTSEVLSPEIDLAIFGAVFNKLEAFAKENPEQMQRIMDHCLKHKQAREIRRYGEFLTSSQD